MDYATAVDTFFTTRPGPAPPRPTTPARQLRDAVEPLATQGWWARETNERYAQLGLDFMTGYVWGRAASLGFPPAPLVVAAFGVFEPGLIATTLEQARATASREEVLAARELGATESLRRLLDASEPELERVTAALQRGLQMADGTARALYSGLAGLPPADDAYGRLWRACELVREHRGDSHLAACIAAGLEPVQMNVLTELYLGMDVGEYTATRGWDDAALAAAVDELESAGLVSEGALTAAGRQHRDEIEIRTDAQEARIIEGIGDALGGILTPLRDWSQQVIDGGAFPPGAHKRAAG